MWSIALVLGVLQTAQPRDVSKLTVGPAVSVVELDLGKLKGELRQIAWSPDALEIYVQTAEGNPPSERLHHYVVSVSGAAVLPVDKQPDWARQYWAIKSDRNAPGVPSVEIAVKQEHVNERIGTGSGRPGTNGTGDGAAGGAAGAENVAMAAEGQRLPLVKFELFGETISEYKNERPIPGSMFGWGPSGTLSLAFTDRDGHLSLLDSDKHTRRVQGVKDAGFPAWSADGARLAWVQKSGRKKYTLTVAPVGSARN